MPHPATPILLLGGASGAGKSYLAARHGRPHVELDNFYRELSEHTPASPLPLTPYGEVDWDHSGTWNRGAAVEALLLLLEAGRAPVPNYSIATSSYAGYRDVSLAEGPVVAEGVFVDEVAEPLRARGVVVDALYIDVHPLTTAVRRFVRDVRERRKPVPFLLKRGWALFRSDRDIRRRYLAAGFRPVSKRRVRRILSSVTPLGTN